MQKPKNADFRVVLQRYRDLSANVFGTKRVVDKQNGGEPLIGVPSPFMNGEHIFKVRNVPDIFPKFGEL